MIYSPAFQQLPDSARAALTARMRQLLQSGQDAAVLEILRDTSPGWD
jgi:hypothetical protein